jgi:hypothetical protein
MGPSEQPFQLFPDGRLEFSFQFQSDGPSIGDPEEIDHEACRFWYMRVNMVQR